ncbi:MAG: hypothetical protein ACHQK9_13535 [Reyranellales bacterium]
MKAILGAAALAASAVALLSGPVQAQSQPGTLRFEEAAYVSCRDAQAMTPVDRRNVAVFLAEHSSRYHGVMLPDGEEGTRLGQLVRAACTLYPESKLFGVIDRAIVLERDKLAKR